MTRIVRLTESDLTRLVRRVIKEQQPYIDENLKVLYVCLGLSPSNIDEIHLDEINELLSNLYDATNDFEFESNWDEEKFINALEMTNPREVNAAQKALTCYMSKKGIKIIDNNPLLTMVKTAFTTLGYTDIGDSEYKKRAQRVLAKLGIKGNI
jgi:hypothetical protein